MTYETIEILEQALQDGPLPKKQLEKTLLDHGITSSFHDVLSTARRKGLPVSYVANRGYALEHLPPGVIRQGSFYFYRQPTGKLSEPFKTPQDAFDQLRAAWQL